MNIITIGGAVALSLVLAACGGSETVANENTRSADAAQATGKGTQVHSGTGTVKAIAGDEVTLAHGAIKSVGWPAMTMSFKSPAGVPPGVQAATQVNFSFRDHDGSYVLTSIQPR